MVNTEVTLSDERPCIVRRLKIFELDKIPPPDTRPFLYSEKIGGKKITRPFDVTAWDEPPRTPTATERAAEPGTVPYFYYYEWQLYYAALYKLEENKQDIERYCKDVAAYIMETCITADDRQRIVSPEDYQAVYYAALVPQLTYEDLEQSLEYTFRANFDGEAVLMKILKEAGEEMDGGNYNALRRWEIQALTQSGFTEDDWADLPLDERARRVCDVKIDDWLAYLTAEKQKKEKKGVYA